MNDSAFVVALLLALGGCAATAHQSPAASIVEIDGPDDPGESSLRTGGVTPAATPDIRAAELKLEAADAEGALRLLERADETNARTFFTRGLAHDLRGDTEAALAAYRRATELEPRFAMAHANRAAAALDRGETAEALAEATEALALAPSSVGPRVTRALAHEGRGELSDAARDLRAALARSRSLDTRAHLARVLEASNERDAATAEYRTLSTADDASAELLLVAAEGLRRLGEFAGASRTLGRAIELSPDQASLYASLALVERERGERDAAERAIRTAIRLDDAKAEYRYVLGGFLAAAGRFVDARVVYSEALSRLGQRGNADLRERIEGRLREVERRAQQQLSTARGRN